MRFITTSITTTTFCLLALAALPRASFGQSYDSSGNGMLHGVYYVRQVIYVVQTSQSPEGTIGEAVNLQGAISFDGNGNYTFNGSVLDSASESSTPQTGVTSAGNYVISASGMGYISAINPEVSGDAIVGLVSNGIFIGSSTQNASGYNDLTIAAPISASSNATLSGTYRVAFLDPTFPGDAFFSMNADGNGNVGTVNATEYVSTNSVSNQTLTGVHYAFSNGAAQFTFGGTVDGSQLIAGTDLLYISPDGNFIFGGSFNGYDMFVGVRAATSAPSNYDGLYYQAGLDFDLSPIGSGYVILDSYYGAIDAFTGQIIGHQSLNSQLVYSGATADYSYYDTYMVNGDGSSSDHDFVQQYWSTADGTVRIGYGLGPYLSLNVALKAPQLSGSGVYLNPQGVVNAASSTPFTAHLSPGEFVTLYGTGLAPSPASAQSLPLQGELNGVQVMINQRPAPLSYVSPNQINLIVPYFTESIAEIQVINNGTASNTVTQFVGPTSAGVFTQNPVGGTGFAAALHPDFSLVTTSSPAQIGETVAVYLAGLGVLNPQIADGDPGLSNPPYSETVEAPLVFLEDGSGNFPQAQVTFSGLAPGFAGLYQLNFIVPSGLVSGNEILEIVGNTAAGAPDSDTFESVLPVGTPSTDVAPQARAKTPGHRRFLPHRPLSGQLPPLKTSALR